MTTCIALQPIVAPEWPARHMIFFAFLYVFAVSSTLPGVGLRVRGVLGAAALRWGACVALTSGLFFCLSGASPIFLWQCHPLPCQWFFCALCVSRLPFGVRLTRASTERAQAACIRRVVSQRIKPYRLVQVTGAGCVCSFSAFALARRLLSSSGSHGAGQSVTWTGVADVRRKASGVKLNWFGFSFAVLCARVRFRFC